MLRTARRPDRPFDVVMVYDSSRFGRNLLQAQLHKRDLDELGIQVAYATFDVDVTTPDGKLMDGINDVISQWFSDKLSVQVHERMRRRAEEGHWAAGRPPFGYRIEKVADQSLGTRRGQPVTRNVLVPNPHQIPTLLRIFKEFVSGKSIIRITHGLVRDGIPGRSGEPGKWVPNSVRHILRNHIYDGWLNWGTTEPRNGNGKARKAKPKDQWVQVQLKHFERIVPKDLFDEAQRRLKTWSERYNGGNERERADIHLLSGILRCHHCCGPMNVYHRDRSRRYYRCARSLNRGRAYCPNRTMIRADGVEGGLFEILKQHVLELRNLKRLTSLVNKGLRDALRNRPKEHRQLERTDTALRRKEERLVEAIGLADNPIDALVAKLENVQAERADLAARREQTAALLSYSDLKVTTADIEAAISDLRKVIDRLDPTMIREAIRPLITRFEAGDDGKVQLELDMGAFFENYVLDPRARDVVSACRKGRPSGDPQTSSRALQHRGRRAD
jgi:DNA invertase Pin-like site-specific DNA recombinase